MGGLAGGNRTRLASATWRRLAAREPVRASSSVRASGAANEYKEIAMGMLKVASFALSLDGFGAGLHQSLENPLGVGGLDLHQWAFATAAFRKMFGNKGGATGIDNDYIERGFREVGAWILGRNMFGPVRGPWPDDAWKGWWGDNPPYHTPVFVLTHHARETIVMEGGTTFHFVTDGIHAALQRARDVAGDLDVRLGGGVATIKAYLRAGLVDELHLAITPVLLGSGERLFADVDMRALGYRCVEHAASRMATHVVLRKR
ncbi:MAG: dihydrofolate reductase family protein [Rhodanobacteraceae bacterium]